MNQDSFKKFLEKVDKICNILDLEQESIKTSLIKSLFTDFRNNFLFENLESESFKDLEKVQDNNEFMIKLDQMGLDSVEKFNLSATKVLNLFIDELQSNVPQEKVEELRKIITE